MNADGTVSFLLAEYPRDWPADEPLARFGEPERAGGGYWTGTVAASEVSDIDDGVPDEWWPFLPTGEGRADAASPDGIGA